MVLIGCVYFSFRAENYFYKEWSFGGVWQVGKIQSMLLPKHFLILQTPNFFIFWMKDLSRKSAKKYFTSSAIFLHVVFIWWTANFFINGICYICTKQLGQTLEIYYHSSGCQLWYLICLKIKEGILLRGVKANGASVFLFFIRSPFFLIVCEYWGTSLSLQRKWTKLCENSWTLSFWNLPFLFKYVRAEAINAARLDSAGGGHG